jgi:RNA-directed DNA polymerase
MKERTRRINAQTDRKSDSVILPKKLPNKEVPASAEAMEGRPLTERNAGKDAAIQTQGWAVASYGLEGVRQRAIADKSLCFTNLLHHITPELLRESFHSLKRKAAAGVDGVSWAQYAHGLDGKLQDLHERIHKGSYRAKPVRRTYIRKNDGSRRPLGVTAVEDKIVQMAVVKVLIPIYDADMLGFSYGFRIGKSQHPALDALAVAIERRRIHWILDADVQAFFDRIPHDALLKLIELRVGDNRIMRLIRKWLKTGYSEDGVIHRQEFGTPQGSVISPFLANIYLHYVLDQWVEYERRTNPCGDVIIVRYADDFVIGFERKATAERFHATLRDRFTAFGLTLHPGKTRLIEFGRQAIHNRQQRGEGKPETFGFLGFTHICTLNRKGRFFLKRVTIAKRLRKKVREVTDILRRAMHKPVYEVGRWLASVLRGFVAYHGVPGNLEALKRFRDLIAKIWFRVLRRRSQKGKSLTWARFTWILDSYLPHVRVCHPFPNVRFDANTRGRSRMR